MSRRPSSLIHGHEQHALERAGDGRGAEGVEAELFIHGHEAEFSHLCPRAEGVRAGEAKNDSMVQKMIWRRGSLIRQ